MCFVLYAVTVILDLYICKYMRLFNVYLMCSRARRPNANKGTQPVHNQYDRCAKYIQYRPVPLETRHVNLLCHVMYRRSGARNPCFVYRNEAQCGRFLHQNACVHELMNE